MSNDDLRIPPSGIGEAAKHNFSPLFIKYKFSDEQPLEGRWWNRAKKSLSAVQSKIGNEFEQRVYDNLRDSANEHINQWYKWGDERNEEKLVDLIRKYGSSSPDSPGMLTQVRLDGQIGVFSVSGDSDLVILFPTNRGVRVHVIDIKSSWEEKPSQQLQTATYTKLIRDTLEKYDLSFNYEITGGILYRDTELDDVFNPEKTPEFQVKSREGDVERILRENGIFDGSLSKTYDDIPLTIDEGSPYAEIMTAQAVEDGDLSILGVTPSEKRTLESFGVENIRDVAELYKPMDDPRPYDFTDPERNPDMESTVEKIVQNKGFASEISTLSYMAQSILGEFDPDNKFAHDKPWYPWMTGTGNGELPEDNPPYDADLPIKQNSMIRVYLDIQHDYVRDEIISFSGVVSSGLYSGEPLEFSNVVNDIDRDPETWGDKNERELLESSISDMYETISFLADFASHGERSAVHFYIYDRNSYDSLYDSILEHETDSEMVSSFRRIMDMREGIDQKMFSIVEEEISSRMAVKDVDTSITSVVERMYPSEDTQKVTDDDWEIQDSTGREFSIKDAYKQNMFDNKMPVKQSESDLWNAKILNDNSNNRTKPDTFYNLSPDSGSQIPIEYLWGSEDIDVLDANWSDDSKKKKIIRDFMWNNREEKNIRLKSSHYQAASRILAKCVLHIERSIRYRNADIHKEPINISELSSSEGLDSGLGNSCLEYLDLESQQAKNDAYEVYSKPLKKRIVDGESIPIRVTNIVEDKGYMFRVKGEIILDNLDIENPEEVASSSKIVGSDSTTGGSRCVSTPLINTNNGYQVAVDDPEAIDKSIGVSVEEFDPKNQKIEIIGYREGGGNNRYNRYTKRWTLDPKNGGQYIGPGESFILDPSADSTMAEKSLKSIQNVNKNVVYNDINRFRKGSATIQDSAFNSDNCDEYIDWISPSLEFEPNDKQAEFIQETSGYSLLQGPPGTGKTSGAISHSIVARAYDKEKRDRELTALVTGLSNKSIDEVMESVSELKKNIKGKDGDSTLENLNLVRLTYEEPKDSLDNVKYLSYRNDRDIEILRRMISSDPGRQATLGGSDSPSHTVLFATPGRIDGLMDQIDKERGALQLYKDSDDIFDLLVIDEASMMPMYQLFMSTPFMKSSGSQILVAGDHRQLPPVQRYEWSDERRKSIQDNLPHLSVLDFFRYLRGDDVDGTYDKTPDSPNVNIPIVRLQRTYRCNSVLTEFLQDTIYRKDGIDYESSLQYLIDSDGVDDKLSEVVSPESPITVIVHDDRESQQVNIVEQEIISEIMNGIDDRYSKGIVTPHNAQKGALSVKCPESTVDTVERFQGGENDLMVLSSTVSDPDHLSKEEEFILSENRLNVALSRMKRKLIVVASESIFELVPQDVDTYENSIIWKSLYSAAGAAGEPSYSTTVSEFTGSDIQGSFSVYNIDRIN